MARYINLDAICEILDEDIKTGDERVTISWVKSWLLTQSKIIIPDSADVGVAPRAEVFEEVDKFRSDLINKFIDLCRGNDYNKLTLLKIGDVVDEMYDRRIAELKKKYTEGQK